MIKKIKYLTQAQFDALTSKDAETEYRITDFTPVTDVQINGGSVLSGGVANIPNSSANKSGVMTPTQYSKLDGIEESAEVNTLEGVQINGTDLTITSKKVNIPWGDNSSKGVVNGNETYGVNVVSGEVRTCPATASDVTAKTQNYKPIVPSQIDAIVKAGLGNYAGTAFTDAEKTTARNTIGAVALEEYDSTATPEDNVLYYVIED